MYARNCELLSSGFRIVISVLDMTFEEQKLTRDDTVGI